MSRLMYEIRAGLYWAAFTAGLLTFGALGFGAISLVANLNPIDIFTGAAGRGPPAPPITIDQPATPQVAFFFFQDSSTARIGSTGFNGDLDDTHANTDWKIGRDAEGAGSCSALTAVVSSLADADSLESITLVSNDSLKADTSYVACVRHEGTNGGDSNWSSLPTAVVNNPTPGLIVDHHVESVTDTSITIEGTHPHDGKGSAANIEFRWWEPPDAWWNHSDLGPPAVDSDSITAGSANINDTWSYTIYADDGGSLVAGDSLEIKVNSFRGTLNDNLEAINTSAPTIKGTTSGGGGSDPATPSLTEFSSAGLDSVRFTGSSFNGSGTHDSTRYILSDQSDLSSPVLDEWVTSPLITRLYINAALTNDGTYYGGIAYAGTGGISSTSAVAGPITNQATPPPSECAGANEPVGFTQITCREFLASPELGWLDTPQSGSFDIVTDATAPSGDSTIGRMTYPTSLVGGDSPYKLTRSFVGPDYTDVYVAFYVKVSSNFYGHSSSRLKVVYITEAGPSAGGALVEFVGVGSNNLFINFTQNDPEFRDVTGSQVARDQWHLVEMRAKFNSAVDVDDGELDIWLNGNLEISLDDVLFDDTADKLYWNVVKWDPVWGGVGSSPPEEMYMYIDRFYASGN